jgi:hypothetical protein
MRIATLAFKEIQMRRMLWLALTLAPAVAHAEGSFWCRWQPGASAVQYAAFDAKSAQGTDVRVVMRGALLVDAEGRLPAFPALSTKQPVQSTAALLCQGDALEATDGLVELTFSRRVSLGIEYTLGRCQLRYRCAPAGAGDARGAPQPLVTDCASEGERPR